MAAASSRTPESQVGFSQPRSDVGVSVGLAVQHKKAKGLDEKELNLPPPDASLSGISDGERVKFRASRARRPGRLLKKEARRQSRKVGFAKGCFVDPNTVFDEGEWKRYGDKLWEDLLNDDKVAKKLAKQWQAVSNALQQHKAEQQAARIAAQRLGDIGNPFGAESPCPLPPSTNVVHIPPEPQEQALITPTAPSLEFSSPSPESQQTSSTGAASLPSPDTSSTVAAERRKLWQGIAADALQAGDKEAAETLTNAFPVVYAPAQGGGLVANITALDWKLLSQLRATVNESGIQGEPTRQMLNYIWGSNLLLPADISNIMKLVLSQHQQMLHSAHWQAFCQEAVAVQRQAADPLHGVTLDELMGLGPYARIEAQALIGPDKIRESMRLARLALDKIKAPGGIPSYMGIKQGRDEPFGSFIDRVANAIQLAGVPEYMRGALLKQCALQNCNSTARNVIVTLPGNWSIEELLERMAQIPQGPNAISDRSHATKQTSTKTLFSVWSIRTRTKRVPVRSGVVFSLSAKHACSCYVLAWVGKRESQREGVPRQDTSDGSNCSQLPGSDLTLRPATRGSLGLDLATTIDCTLIDQRPQKIPTGVHGPVLIDGKPVGALLIGRSSSTMAGLTVLVGLIDADYTGEISIMVNTLFPPLHIPARSRIAQLIPLPQIAPGPSDKPERGDQGFGSTGTSALLTIDLARRPRKAIQLQWNSQTAHLIALLDTGADVSIVAACKWPTSWPLVNSGATVAGVGGLTLAKRSPPITITLDEMTVNYGNGSDQRTKIPFSMTAIAWTFPIPLQWKTETPVWVEQWPLKRESLLQAHALVSEQLQQGHLRLSTSPWNTPIFVIRKKSGKYRLLHDLRAVNAQMHTMGALQPGLPNPAMIPQNWFLLIIDLKDCFFTIALHEQDRQRFAFTIPAINKEGPAQRYEWTVLPQGMKNSPTLCQLYVDAALQPIRKSWPSTVIYHYVDDLLFAQPTKFTKDQKQQLVNQLQQQGLVIATEKIQESSPWHYLGWQITDSVVRPQKLSINIEIATLYDAQRLLGDLQWLRPVVGIPNEWLEPLRPLLKGTDPSTAVTVTPEQRNLLHRITTSIADHVTHRRIEGAPVNLTILAGEKHFMGALTQQIIKTGDNQKRLATSTKGQQIVLEWLTTSLQPRRTVQERIRTLSELIRKGRNRIVQATGSEPHEIQVPIRQEDLDWYLVHSPELQGALLVSDAIINIRPLQSPTLAWMANQAWLQVPKRSATPLQNAVTVFTDAGKRSQRAVATWRHEGRWHQHFLSAHYSMYVAGVANRIEDASIREVKNARLMQLLQQLHKAIAYRSARYAVLHIRSHQWNIGLGEGNARADRLVSTVTEAPIPPFLRAREAHAVYHQNAKGLSHSYGLSIEDARAIVKACPICSQQNNGVGLGVGVNPKGLKANELWQMDVTHVPAFGRLKYMHVSIDTYSHFVWATLQPGEKVQDVKRHLTDCFAVMGVPKTLKTDNGPAYVSKILGQFLQQWDIKHVTGIAHSPTGQAIVERMNGTIKSYLEKYKDIRDARERVSKTLFVLNHLCIFGDDSVPPIVKHNQKEQVSKGPPMKVPCGFPVVGSSQQLRALENEEERHLRCLQPHLTLHHHLQPLQHLIPLHLLKRETLEQHLN
ncbi:uncharacterized protein LOC127466311 [Manacus candei]|uniref:uncharacterized protein LOC127466311 n=1 Tax=Manacus candei TaxID=415023 RepID=UPI002225B9C7|nr:uncharacterized protein LOC127466311 [Manacus candei]